MMQNFRQKLPLIGAGLFWLLPLAAYPLAFARLTGNKIPLFGMVQGIGFTGLGLISLAIVIANFRRVDAMLKNSLPVRMLAIAGTAVISFALIQQATFGGSWEHFGHALFYAATPLAAAAIAPLLKRALPTAAAIGAAALLSSGIMSENFTGLTGNWNWTQILFFALLPGFFIRFKGKTKIKYPLMAIFFFWAAGSLFYPEQLSNSLAAALPLTAGGMFILYQFPRRLKKVMAAAVFILTVAAIVALGIFCHASDSRIQLFASTINLLKVHGLIGVGADRFFDFIQNFITPEYFLAPFPALHHPHPHNELLHLWSAFGIAGIFFAGTLFCGVLNAFPTGRNLKRNLLPVWIFLLIFICAQSDLTGAIISGAFWMLGSAGCVMAPEIVTRKTDSTPRAAVLISGALILMALISIAWNLRTTLPLRQGRLAALAGNAPAALKHYQRSIAIKPTAEALYGCAEIALHGFQDPGSALAFLNRMRSELGVENYLHTNRIFSVALVNTGKPAAALAHIRKEINAYPVSIINRRLHLDLLRILKASDREIADATAEYIRVCQLRGISPARGNTITMTVDDQPLPSTANAPQQLAYPRLFPGIINELTAAVTLFLAALGVGGLCCLRRRQTIMVELAAGIIGCAIAGALLPPAFTPLLLPFPALAGIYLNWEKLRRNWKVTGIFLLLTLFMLANALLPPASWDEQVYQISLLKKYAETGFWNCFADNPYSAYPSLIHAFLLCGFDWGGATLPRLITLLLYTMTGAWIYRKFAPSCGKFCTGAILAAALLSPLSLLLVRNFYAEPFILIFTIAGTAVLLKNSPLDRSDFFLAGIAAGGAVAVKLTGGGAALGLAVLMLFRERSKRSWLFFVSGGIAAAALFYCRTWIFFGNPFYPYGSTWFGASESACLVEKFHHLLGGHYGLDPLQGTLYGWLFTAFKPELYDGVSAGFQFPLLFVAALAGTYLAGKQDKSRRTLWFGMAAALLTVYLFWGMSARQSRFIYPVFFASALLALAAASRLSALWKNLLAALALAATLVSLMNSNGPVLHYYFSCRVLPNARSAPAGFAATREHGYARLLHQVNQLPENARIAMLTERRTLYMPRPVTLLLPHFQEQLTPVPDDTEKLWETISRFDYLIIRIPTSDVDRAPEYDDEINKLYLLIHRLLRQGRLQMLPESEMTILRVVTAAAGQAPASSSANSVSRVSADARLRNDEGNPRPRR